MGRAVCGTRWLTHPNLKTAADWSFKRDTHNCNTHSWTTWRQPRVQRHFLEVVRLLFCSLDMSMPGGGATVLGCLASTPSLTHCTMLRETTCTSKLRRNLAWTRHSSACGSRDAGMGHVLRVRGARRLRSEQLLTGSVLPVRPPTQTTVVVLCARRRLRGIWEQRSTLSGADSKSARGWLS